MNSLNSNKPNFIKTKPDASSTIADNRKVQFESLFDHLINGAHANPIETQIQILAHMLRLVFLVQNEQRR